MSKVTIPYLQIKQHNLDVPFWCPYRIYKESLLPKENFYARNFCKIDQNIVCLDFDTFPSNCPLKELDADKFVHTSIGDTFQCEKATTCDRVKVIDGKKHCECSLECFKKDNK